MNEAQETRDRLEAELSRERELRADLVKELEEVKVLVLPHKPEGCQAPHTEKGEIDDLRRRFEEAQKSQKKMARELSSERKLREGMAKELTDMKKHKAHLSKPSQSLQTEELKTEREKVHILEKEVAMLKSQLGKRNDPKPLEHITVEMLQEIVGTAIDTRLSQMFPPNGATGTILAWRPVSAEIAAPPCDGTAAGVRDKCDSQFATKKNKKNLRLDTRPRSPVCIHMLQWCADAR